jgi:hypothetical protein
MPIGSLNEQQLVLFTNGTRGACVARRLGPVVFTPLVS